MENPKKHAPDERENTQQAPKKSIADRLIDGALKTGSGMVSLLSGLLATVLILYSGYVLVDTFHTQQ